jgi:hypothetical protein
MPIRNSFKYKDIVAVLKYYDCRLIRDGKGFHENRENSKTKKEPLFETGVTRGDQPTALGRCSSRPICSIPHPHRGSSI